MEKGPRRYSRGARQRPFRRVPRGLGRNVSRAAMRSYILKMLTLDDKLRIPVREFRRKQREWIIAR